MLWEICIYSGDMLQMAVVFVVHYKRTNAGHVCLL